MGDDRKRSFVGWIAKWILYAEPGSIEYGYHGNSCQPWVDGWALDGQQGMQQVEHGIDIGQGIPAVQEVGVKGSCQVVT